MDVYSLAASMEAVLEYLREVDPEAAKWVDRRYKCFDRWVVVSSHNTCLPTQPDKWH